MEHQERLPPYLMRCVEQRTSESIQELEARLKIEEQKAVYELCEKAAAARHQRFCEKLKLITFMAGMLLITVVCLHVSFSGRFQHEDKKAASTIIQSVVMGIVGYLAGKASNKIDPR